MNGLKGIGAEYSILAVEDIDNDGIVEAVVGNDSGFLQTLELKNGKWQEEWKGDVIAGLYSINSVKIGDLDGDGKKEIVGGGNRGDDGSIFIIDAKTKNLIREYSRSNRAIENLIDVNNDGKLEIVVSNLGVYFIFDLNFQELWHTPDWNPGPISILDIDNDGAIEIICGKNNWDPVIQEVIGHNLYIYNGSTFEIEYQSPNLPWTLVAFTSGDIDNDGKKEIVTVTDNYAQKQIKFTSYKVVGNGVVQKEIEWSDGRIYPYFGGMTILQVLDVDKDNVNELIYYSENTSDGRSAFVDIYNGRTKQLEWSGGQNVRYYGGYPNCFKILDTDADGIPDIVLGDLNDILVLRILDGKTKLEKRRIEIPVTPEFYGNIDSDSQPEVILHNLQGIDCKTGISEVGSYLGVDMKPFCQIGDIDGDGKKEILLPKATATQVIIHIFDGVTKQEKAGITLSNANGYNGYSVKYLYLSDVNSDNRPDIFIGTFNGPDYIIDGFTKSIIWQGSVGWMPAKVIDVDNDGQLEVLGYNDYYLHIYNLATKDLEWPNEGEPHYALSMPYEIEAVDLDNDGIVEIIIGQDSGWGDGLISVYNGITKTLKWLRAFAYPNGLEGFAVADIDRDQSQELLCGRYEGQISILDGVTKNLEGEFGKLSFLHGLAVGDVNNDGHDEIIATNGWENWNYLYVFDGITYEQKFMLNNSLGREAQDIKIIDVDSDGINEIIMQSKGYVNIIGFHPNKPPVFNAINNKQIGEGVALTFTVSATDPDQDAITYSASGLPSGASLDSSTGAFSWTPTYSQQGVYSVTFSAFDGTVSVFKTITITVVDIDPNITHKANIAVTSYTNNVAFNNPIIISANVTNLGTLTWVPSTFKFRTHAYLPDGRYVNDLIGNGYTLPRNTLPGETITMNLSIPTGPSTQLNILGLYRIGLDMVNEGVKWFGNEVRIDVTIQNPTNNAGFVAQWVPNVMTQGQIYSAAIIMKNTGNISWKASQGYKLGSQKDRDNITWGKNRILLTEGRYPTESVAPDRNKVFTFDVTTPATPGTYNFQWKMVKEYVEWFGQATPNLKITVIPNDNSVIYYSDGTGQENWQVSDRRGNYGISVVYDSQLESNAIETRGDYRSGYILGGNWANTTHKIIEWKIKARDYRVYIKVKVKDRNNRIYNRYITYHPTTHHTQDANNTYISQLLPGTNDNNWHTITKNLQADLTSGPYGQPNMTLVSVEGFLIRGAVRVDDILVKK